MGIGVRRGRGQSKKVKLQTRAITEVMYTAYSFVTTKGSLVIFFWQNTCKLGKKISCNQTFFIMYLLQVQAALAPELLLCFCGSIRMCR